MQRLLFLGLFCLSFSASAAPLPDFPFVIVSEEMTEQVAPNTVKINLWLKSESASLPTAMAQLQTATQQLIAVLKQHKVELSALEADGISKQKVHDEDKQGNPLISYRVSQGFEFKFADLPQYPSLVNALQLIEDVINLEPSFDNTDANKYKAKLLEKLSLKTREKADQLAAAQQRLVDKVYGITTEENFGQSFAAFGLSATSTTMSFNLASINTADVIYASVPKSIPLKVHMTAIYQLKK